MGTLPIIEKIPHGPERTEQRRDRNIEPDNPRAQKDLRINPMAQGNATKIPKMHRSDLRNVGFILWMSS